MFAVVLAGIATACVVSSYVPQIVRGYRTRSLQDVSIWFLLIILLSTVLWIWYAIIVADRIILVANSLILIFALWLTGLKLRYRH